MKSIVFSCFAIFGVFLATEAWGGPIILGAVRVSRRIAIDPIPPMCATRHTKTPSHMAEFTRLTTLTVA